jgi:hypothetical protein
MIFFEVKMEAQLPLARSSAAISHMYAHLAAVAAVPGTLFSSVHPSLVHTHTSFNLDTVLI